MGATASENLATRSERVIALAEKVFGDRAKANRWLRESKYALDGATPLACLASEAGAQAVEDMLHQIQHGMIA
jgi:putative toxin-antitoxin system antitoxin component (TIGR02293 family)